MTRPPKSLFAAAVLTTALCLAAATSKADTPMQGDPNAGFAAFFGTWTCVANVSAMGPNMPAHTETDTMTFDSALGGAWVHQHYTGKVYTSDSYFRYDKAASSWTSIAVDNMGGHGMSTSSGMNGNTMVFEGPYTYGGKTSTSRDTVTVMDKNKLRHVGSYKDGDTWKQTDDTVCTKS
ncbi:MAG: hypothetical protein DLM53_06255 [Candidatus Eremiobacter antarcticus]|nr:DUF1579 family protein [Candidatus Eremiobacteraeota bacterium]MBC5807109.1 DUF1579 family protein [Candidatus Eremiobacteraeota bacterium]PZR62415.1 MAG: hypothetical protein DLM53_06255 [Candidatus Eremiobacter sp. RRmetagenome_bin22]